MITPAALAERVIPFASLRYTTEAFIDYCLPECTPKFNYALIGPGVSQNPKQPVSLREPHGFQVGGVSIPHGRVNTPHLHFTCEVFICARGDWRVQWGFNPQAHSTDITEGDLVSVPTWIYRGFTNIGVDDGFMFTALGGDHTGGILWSPATLEAASKRGVFLTEDSRIIDTNRGDPLPPGTPLMQPMTSQEIAALRVWSPQQMASRVVRHADLVWSAQAFLDAGLPGCGAQLAPAIGLGISQDRNALAPVVNAHGLSIEWLRIPVGGKVSSHQLAEKQVVIVKRGALAVEVITTDGPATHEIAGGEKAWDTMSVPAGVWRELRNAGSTEVLALLLTSGDHRKRIHWAPDVVAQAGDKGWGLDADAFVAPKRFVDRAQR